MKWIKRIGLAFGLAVMFMMAEVERATFKPVAAGTVPTVLEGLSAADTQLIPNKLGNVTIRINNGGAEATKATVVTPNAVGGNLIADLENEVAPGATEIMGPFDPSIYNNSKGFLELKLTKVASVKLEIQETGF